MTGFFLPWDQKQKPSGRRRERRLYLPKETAALEDACFDTRKPAYVSLPNPRGTLRSFLTAVETGKKEEAMRYFSERVADLVDYEELEGYLKDFKEYYCFAEEAANGMRTISVAHSGGEGDIFSFYLVAEPDAYGKWKIVSMVKEGRDVHGGE